MQAAADGVPCVAVGFSPPEALAALADHLSWTGPFLSDPDRRLYERLGVRRAPTWRIWSPRTVLRYAVAGRRPRAVEDTRQLGGDAVVVDGIVVHRWLPRTPSDRVPPATLVASATSR